MVKWEVIAWEIQIFLPVEVVKTKSLIIIGQVFCTAPYNKFTDFFKQCDPLNFVFVLQLVTKWVEKGALWRFTDFKRWKYSFSSPLPSLPCNVVPLFELPSETNEHPNFEWRDRGGMWILMFSDVTLYLIVSPVKYILSKDSCK